MTGYLGVILGLGKGGPRHGPDVLYAPSWFSPGLVLLKEQDAEWAKGTWSPGTTLPWLVPGDGTC